MSFSVLYNYRINDQMSAPLRKIQGNMSKFDAQVKGLKGSLMGLSGKFSGLQNILGSVVGVLGGAALMNKFMTFEQALNDTRAVSKASAEDLEKLREQAKKLGATTKFTATEAGKGMLMLAKNGMTVQQILEGALKATLNLSSASGATLPTAADIMTDAFKNFGIEAKDMTRAVDNMAGVVVSSKFDMLDYGHAIHQAVGVATGDARMSLEDFNATIAMSAHVMSGGSDAGTTLKNFLMRLTTPTDEARKIFRRLNMEFYDAEGVFKTMPEIIDELRKGFDDLTDEQRSRRAGKIFGLDAIKLFNVLMKESSESFNKLKKAIKGVSAEEMAAIRMKGLVGTFTLMKSALESLNIAIFDSGLADLLMRAFKWTSALAAKLAESHPTFLKIIGGAGALAIAFGPLMLGLSVLTTGMASLITLLPIATGLMTAFGVVAGIVLSPVTLITAAIVGGILAVLAIIKYWKQLLDMIKKIPAGFLKVFGGGGFKGAGALGFAGGEGGIAETTTAPIVAQDKINTAMANNVVEVENATQLNGEIRVVAPPGVVKNTVFETSAPGDLGMNLAGTI